MSAPPSARPCLRVLASAVAALATAAHAQSQEWRIVPSISLDETYTDNVRLAPEALAESGWITDLAPGLRIERNGPRLKVFVDSRFHVLRYPGQSQLDNTQSFVDALARLEAIEKWLFIDARATVTQQNRTALGAAATPDQPSANPNRVEARVAQIAPYTRGYIGDNATYLVKAGASQLAAEGNAIPRTRTYDFNARLRNAVASSRFGWTADASTVNVRNDELGSLDDNRLRASLIYSILPTLRVSAIGGYDSTEFADPERKSGSVVGGGLTWNPSPRTLFAGVYEDRFFGATHNVLFQYRTPRTAWRAVSSKDLTLASTLLANGDFSSTLNVMNDLLATSIPDPEEREQVARRRLEQVGLAGTTPLSGAFLTDRPMLLRQSEFTGVLNAPRDTLSLRYQDREQKVTGPVPGGGPAFDPNQDNRQRRFVAQWAHRLTPLTSLALAATLLRTRPLNTPGDESTQREYLVTWTTRLGPKTTASLAVRHVNFDGALLVPGYRENAVVGVVSLQL